MASIECEELRALRKKLQTPGLTEALVPGFKEAMTTATRRILQEVPHGRSGQLQDATDVDFTGPLSASISTDDARCPYAKYVYTGTRAHTVHPVRAKALQWFVGGQVRYAYSAVIPAQKPRPYLETGWAKHQGEFIEQMTQEVQECLDNLGVR